MVAFSIVEHFFQRVVVFLNESPKCTRLLRIHIESKAPFEFFLLNTVSIGIDGILKACLINLKSNKALALAYITRVRPPSLSFKLADDQFNLLE